LLDDLQDILVDFANFWLTVPQTSLHLNSSDLTLLPLSGSFGVTKKAKAGRLGVSGPPLFLPKSEGSGAWSGDSVHHREK
jgi:hypothetical protein